MIGIHDYHIKSGLLLSTALIFSLMVFLTVVLFWMLILKFDLPHVIYIDTESPSCFTTGKNFLSIALDTIIIADNFRGFNLTNAKLIQMVKYLSPAFIRFGGNMSDKLIFLPEKDNSSQFSSIQETDYLKLKNFTMTGLQWLTLAKFVEMAHLEPIFGLNALVRFENGSWDYRNAKELIEYSNQLNIRVHWELGNEPNSFMHKFKKTVNASQLGKDFFLLREILNGFPLYQKSLLLGPDVTRPLESHKESQIYMKEFLDIAGKVINAVTWHQYYLNGRTAKPQDFLNPVTFELLQDQIKRAKKIVHCSPQPNRKMWLGETSSAYGGGAPNLSNTFIGSFLWIDKLGLSAKNGISIVIRQSIFKGNYALLDENYDPNPDWWISILFKSLVDNKTVPYLTATSSTVRLYVQCSKKTFFNGSIPSITIFGMNLDNFSNKVQIEGIISKEPKSHGVLKAYIYELTFDEKITSQGIRLNGEILRMLPNNVLPVFVPRVQYKNFVFNMPPLSIVFWVIPTSKVKACL